MKAKYRIRFVPPPYVHVPVARPGCPVIPNGRQPEPFHVERRTWFGWKVIERAATLDSALMFLSGYVRNQELRPRVCKAYDRQGKEIT